MRIKKLVPSSGLVVVLFAASGCLQADAVINAPTSSYEVSSRNIPKEYDRTYEFLETIKYLNSANAAFDAKQAPHWNISKVISFLSKDGVIFSDVNGGFNGHAGNDDIRRALSERKGDVFTDFAHLSYIYSQPYKQYSELHFTPTPSGVIVHIADLYNLTFKYEGGTLQLTNCDYLEIEGD